MLLEGSHAIVEQEHLDASAKSSVVSLPKGSNLRVDNDMISLPTRYNPLTDASLCAVQTAPEKMRLRRGGN